jgi:hypothetical protein
MPYGQDFLDKLDKMLNDGGQTSNRVKNTCSKCKSQIEGMSDYEYSLTWSPERTIICRACDESDIIGIL